MQTAPPNETDEFRVLLDRFFHGAPMEANGVILPTETAKSVFWELSRLTYRYGKQGIVDARSRLTK